MKFWAHETVILPPYDIHRPIKTIGKGTKIWAHSQIKGGAVIGENCTIGHNCFIGSQARIGNGVKIQSNVDVWDYVILHDFVFVGAGVAFTNDLTPRAKYPKKEYPEYGKWLPTIVEEGATIGANATILCGIKIGAWAMIGAGAVVTHDIIPYALMYGVPAEIKGFVCECGNKVADATKTHCPICQREYKFMELC